MKRYCATSDGFTLIEALMAMTVFAVGTLMIVPNMVAWVRANAVSMQRDQAGQVLDRAADTLAAQGWQSTEWQNLNGTSSNLNTAIKSDLDHPNYTQWASYKASEVPYDAQTDVEYAAVGVTNNAGQQVARVMKIRVQWTGPAGKTFQATRILQRNDAP